MHRTAVKYAWDPGTSESVRRAVTQALSRGQSHGSFAWLVPGHWLENQRAACPCLRDRLSVGVVGGRTGKERGCREVAPGAAGHGLVPTPLY